MECGQRVVLGAFEEEASLPSGQQRPDKRKLSMEKQLLHTQRHTSMPAGARATFLLAEGSLPPFGV